MATKLPKLTKKQKDFAKEYLETGNGVQSALKAYDTTDYKTASVIAHENLEKPRVKEYLESKADKAAEFIYKLAESAENEGVRLSASKDILDRSGFKAFEQEPPKTVNNTYNMLFSAETQASIAEIEAKIKANLIKPHVEETD